MTNLLPRATYGVRQIIAHDSDGARDLCVRSQYGEMKPGGHVVFMPLEALYLLEKNRLCVEDSKYKLMSFKQLFGLIAKKDKHLLARYSVYCDFRDRGYVIKTALKFGADFRVYERGVKMGEDHAKWIVLL
jgi:tRNA-intron endonuclease